MVEPDGRTSQVEVLQSLHPLCDSAAVQKVDAQARVTIDLPSHKLQIESEQPPERFAAYLNTLRWNCVTSSDPNLLRSRFRAG